MTDPAREIRRTLNTLIVATVLMYALLAAVFAGAFINAQAQRTRISEVATSTHQALCTLRSDLVQRVADSANFLADHPNGIPGISADQIKQSIENQQRTIDSLSLLHC